MRRIQEIVNTFAPSRPIFKLTLSDNGGSMRMNTNDPVYNNSPRWMVPSNDRLLDLVIGKHSEYWNSRDCEMTMNKMSIIENAKSEIRAEIGEFLLRNMRMKNPRQSKLYKWALRDMPFNYDFNEIVLMLFNYIHSFCNEELVSTDKAHTDNLIALLTAMEEKYNV